MNVTGLWTKYSAELAADPLLVLALTAALVALASTPIAFAVLGRMHWFKARRGRVLQRPAFSSIVVGVLLVMAIPAIFGALVLKSRSFDKNRYEFDPNRTWSVLEQGRGLKDVEEADAAVRAEMQRLALERKNLVENVKKLDQAMLALRAAAGTSPSVAQAFPGVLQALAGVRKSVGVDGPQQLLGDTAVPVDLRSVAAAAPAATLPTVAGSPAAATAPASASAVAPELAGGAGGGLPAASVQAELEAVPEPQRTIAAMLPLTDLPADWTPGKSGSRYIEAFSADNLYEKIDGRAESFLQYSVKGMAYTFYHPTGDPSNELQLYIYEMADPLKALGKYGSEKPDEARSIPVGDEGYTAAGSTHFYAGRYYTQIVSTLDDPKFAAFAQELAKRIAARQKPASAEPVTPAFYFALLPEKGKQGSPKYVAQDVFGYSFFTDVFMADYKDGNVTWQGFVRPYRDAAEAKRVFETYKSSVQQDGAQVTSITAEGADEMIRSASIGLFDVVFRKGNTLAGANGGTSLAPAESFARGLAGSLPAHVQQISPQSTQGPQRGEKRN
ncbi:MAG: DUF6599 family protein [Isosphaeraceae bacterium]